MDPFAEVVEVTLVKLTFNCVKMAHLIVKFAMKIIAIKRLDSNVA